MKKNKNDGFFLSETMVVITIVAVVLLGVFKIFSSVYIKYKESENYNTINALNIVTSMDNYYKVLDINYNTVIGSNSYVDITNYDTNDTEYYTNLKETIGVNKIYLVDMSKIFIGTNINSFNVLLRKYLNTLQSKNLGIIILVVTSNNEYGYIKTSSGTNVTLVGDANDEYSVLVPIGGAFTDPGYENWSGDSPTITWETPLNVNVKGTYYLRYNFNGYLLRRKVVVGDTIYNYSYTGDVQTFTVPVTGWYQIETWGASGNTWNGASNPGLGGYTSGLIHLNKNENIYIYVGSNSTSFNGGSVGGKLDQTEKGGGATDVRLVSGNWNDTTSINSRIMVAGGGGGTGEASGKGGNGGPLFGIAGTPTGSGSGGSQIAGGAGGTTTTVGSPGGFGYGGSGGCESCCAYGGSGGSGYYGGGGGSGIAGTDGAGGGGSSFISGYAGVNAITSASSTTATNNTIHYSGKYFKNGIMTSGVNSGNGKAKITFISDAEPTRTNIKLNNVRYIKDCVNGSSVNVYSHWVELQAIYSGTNVAKGKTVTGTATENPTYPYSRVTDGDINSESYASGSSSSGLQCVTVDLGQTYNLDEIAIWHYWGDGRTYNSNTTYVSSDNSTWTPVIANASAETSQGKRVSAYDANTTITPIYRVSNLVTNGSFENGTNNWDYFTSISISSNQKKFGSYSARNLNGAQYSAIYYSSPANLISVTSDHIYYVSDWIYLVNAGSGYCYSDITLIYNSTNNWFASVGSSGGIFNTWKKLSNRVTIPSVTTPKLSIATAAYSQTDSIIDCYSDGVLIIDLTATFGAGNEPSQAWCNANLNYFDGSQNLNLTL